MTSTAAARRGTAQPRRLRVAAARSSASICPSRLARPGGGSGALLNSQILARASASSSPATRSHARTASGGGGHPASSHWTTSSGRPAPDSSISSGSSVMDAPQAWGRRRRAESSVRPRRPRRQQERPGVRNPLAVRITTACARWPRWLRAAQQRCRPKAALSRRRSTPGPAGGAAGAGGACGSRARSAARAAACQLSWRGRAAAKRPHLRPGAGCAMGFPALGAAKSHTRQRAALRHGSWPRRAQRSPNATPHGLRPWKFAAPGRAEPLPRGGQPVRRHAGATRPPPTRPLLRAGQPHASATRASVESARGRAPGARVRSLRAAPCRAGA